jgi:hypothetical protein
MCQYLEKYYTGDKLILINTEERHGDERADYRLYGNLSELVSYVAGYDPDAVFEEQVKKVSKKTAGEAKETKKAAKDSCKS